METAICGASALAYWRTPPVVRAICFSGDDATDLPVDGRRLAEVRREAHRELGIWRHGSLGISAGRPASSAVALDVLDAAARIAPSVEPPVDVLVSSREGRRRSSLLRPHVIAPELADHELVRVTRTLCVTSPELTLLTLASSLTLAQLVMVASELCGTFSVYRPPKSVEALLEELNRDGFMPRMSSWVPSFEGGALSDLWSRPRLTTPERLLDLARRAHGRRGCRMLERAARLCVPLAASPLEVQAGMLLGLPPELGGEGYAGFSHNHEVVLDVPARRIARRAACRCDLFWPGEEGRRALDLECHSRLYHGGEGQALSDADRTTALQGMGVEVLLVTYGQLESPARFDALSGMVAEKIGRTPPSHTEGFLAARADLRSQVLVSWASLAFGDGR